MKTIPTASLPRPDPRENPLFSMIKVFGALSIGLAFALAPAVTHADEEMDAWWSSRTEFEMLVNASSGGDEVEYQGQRELIAAPIVYGWNTYLSDLGHYEVNWSSFESRPLDSGLVTFTILEGDGQIISPGTAVNTNGQTTISMGLDSNHSAGVSFVMGTSATTIQIDVTHGGMMESQWVTYSIATQETWTYDHFESTLAVSLEVPDGSHEIAEGDSRAVNLHMENQSWEVYVSSWGRMETRNYSVSPAVGATAQGNGVGGTPAEPFQVDESGNATLWFTMGSEATTLTVGSAYGGSSTAEASIDFTPAPIIPEVWIYDHSEGYLSAAITSDSPTENCLVGSTHTVTTNVTYTSWEVWTSNLGNTTIYNYTSSPASGALVSLSIPSGDSTLSEWSSSYWTVYTDADGNASTTVNIGNVASTVRADVCFGADSSVYATLDYPDPQGEWVFDHHEEPLTIALASHTEDFNAVQVAVTATHTSRDIYRFTLTGDTEVRNEATVPASYIGLESTRTSAAGSYEPDSFSTDGDGNHISSFYLWDEEGLFTVTGTDSNGVTVSAQVPLPCHDNMTGWSSGSRTGSSATGGGTAGGGTAGGGTAGGGTAGGGTAGGGTAGGGSAGGGSGGGGSGGGGSGGGADSWVFDHMGGSLSAETSVAANNDYNTASVTAALFATTWEVWTNTITGEHQWRNASTFPATGASFSWYDEGTFLSGGTADSTGHCQIGVAQRSNAYALTLESGLDVTFKVPTGQTPSVPPVLAGSLPVTVPAVGIDPNSDAAWRFDHVGGYLSVGLAVNPNTGSGPDETVIDTVHGTVTATTWEVWVNIVTGNSVSRNMTTFPAENADLIWSVNGVNFQTNASGDGHSQVDVPESEMGYSIGLTASLNVQSRIPLYQNQLTTPQVTGWATMDSYGQIITGGGDNGGGSGSGGSGGGGGGGGGGTGIWQFDHYQGTPVVTIASPTTTPATATLVASVVYDYVEVWVNTQTGAKEERNPGSGLPSGAVFAWGLVGTSPGNASVDASGPSATVTLGTQPSTVGVTVTFNNQSASAVTIVAASTQDSDGDGFTDPEERDAGSDPNDPTSTPDNTPGGSCPTSNP